MKDVFHWMCHWMCCSWSSRADCCPLLPVLQLTYLPPPWGECRSSEMGLDFFPVYSITACRIDCETRYIVENCNCRMVHMPGQCRGRAATGHPGPPATFFAFLTRWDTLHPLHKDAKGCCSGKTVIWRADISGAGGNIQSGNQGNIPGLQSGQKLGEHSSQCSIRLLAACSSSLLELSDHISRCLQFSHPGVVHIQTPRCLLLSSRYFTSCIQMSGTLSSGARVHQPANEPVCPDISVVRLTMRIAITRGSQLVTASRGWCWLGQEELDWGYNQWPWLPTQLPPHDCCVTWHKLLNVSVLTSTIFKTQTFAVKRIKLS